MFRKLSYALVVTFAASALLFSGCAKKEDPNISYDSEQDGSKRAGSGGIGEEDIGGGGRSGSMGSIAGLITVYFDYDSASLSAETRTMLEQNVNKLKSEKNLRVQLAGHCDERGSTEYNLALGERRATSVRDYLANLGINRNRLKTISYGEERPAASGSSEGSYAKNRRVEFTSAN